MTAPSGDAMSRPEEAGAPAGAVGVAATPSDPRGKGGASFDSLPDWSKSGSGTEMHPSGRQDFARVFSFALTVLKCSEWG